MMPLSMPPDGTKPSSVPPVSRSWSWLSVAARKLYVVGLVADADDVLPRSDRDLGELDAAHELLLAVGIDAIRERRRRRQLLVGRS